MKVVYEISASHWLWTKAAMPLFIAPLQCSEWVWATDWVKLVFQLMWIFIKDSIFYFSLAHNSSAYIWWTVLCYFWIDARCGRTSLIPIAPFRMPLLLLHMMKYIPIDVVQIRYSESSECALACGILFIFFYFWCKHLLELFAPWDPRTIVEHSFFLIWVI